MPVLTKINTNSIAEDAITGDKFAGDAYLANTANQNISGTYSENRLYTSDAYTLSGNATINSHLTLSSVKPTVDVVLTAGGAYTITGTGVLSAGTLLAKANTDASTLSGALGSAVTGSPNLNLGNTTFPAGHIIQNTVLLTESGGTAIGNSSTSYGSPLWKGSLVPKLSSTESFIRICVQTNQVHSQENIGVTSMTLTTSENTNHNDADRMHNTTAPVRFYIQDAENRKSSWSLPWSWEWVSGTDKNSTKYVGNLSSWSAGQTLYWQSFWCKASGSNNIYPYLANGRMEFRFEEVTI